MNSMKRSGLKLFSLCVLALGLAAFSASAAQAEGVWMISGTNIEKKLIEVAPFFEGNFELLIVLEGGKLKLVRTDGTLLTTLGLNKVNFLCTNSELVNAWPEFEGAISEISFSARAAFSGCTTIINGATSKACEPKATGKAAGTIETEKIYALLTLHKLESGTTDAVIVVTPKAGSVFAAIHMGESCAIGEEVKLFGSLALTDVGGNASLLVEKSVHIFQEFSPLTALKVANFKSEGQATIDGRVETSLTTGEVWNGLYK
jgi:hypothetical protein